MGRIGCIFFLILIGSSIVVESQRLVFTKTPIVFYSPSKQLFEVIDNDTLYSSKGVGDPWKVSKIHYQMDIDYSTLASDFIPVSTSKGDFFVVAGCGMVYQMRGDSIVRIDHSFRHKNQFGAFLWVKEDTIFMTGGYGFFESTNITTYFDWDTKGWFHRRCSGDVPPDFSGATVFQEGDDLYFFGGREENIHGMTEINQVRRLNTRNWEWKNLGPRSLPWSLEEFTWVRYDKNGGQVARNGATLIDFDGASGKMDVYKSEKFFNVLGLVPEGNVWMLLLSDHHQASLTVELVDKNNYLGQPISQVPLYDTSLSWGSMMVVLMLLILLALAIWNWRRPSFLSILKSGEVENVVWSESEIKLLDFFFSIGEVGFETTELNQFFDHGDPNFDTLKKRRDLKMREMKKKLAQVSGISSDKIFLEKRLDSDRRIKKLYLNPEIKRENLGISL